MPNAMPGQHQDVQPGREHAMHPEPDFMPLYPGSGRLEGKVAIITGGDSGIGRAVALLFAREGAKLAIGYLEEDRDAEDTLRLIEEEGGDAILVKGDVGDRSFCKSFVNRTMEKFGRLDILVNNAAEQHVREELDEVSEENLIRVFKTNIFGYFYMIQAALDHLQEGGRIINTSSIVAYRGQPQLMD